MVKKEELFVLIKSLSKSEKRYFKLYCSREESGNNYLRLFDAIDSQAVYDHERLLNKFKNEPFVRQIHVTKNYLSRLILKCLRNFHSNLSKEIEVGELLHNVEILYNKELLIHCRRELAKAELIAKKHEIYARLVDIDSWKRKLEQAQNPNNFKYFKGLANDQASAIHMLQNTNNYWRLGIDVSTGLITQDKEKINNIQLLDNPENALTFEARILHYNISYIWNLGNEKRIEAQAQLELLVGLLNKNPEHIRESPGLFASSINNLLSFLVISKKYSLALEYIQQAKVVYEGWGIKSENRSLLRQILRTYNIELEICRALKSFEASQSFIARTEIFVKENVYKIPKDYLLTFWFQLASIWFMQKNYSKSLYWINEFLNSKFREIRSDLLIQIHILNLIVHFEQENLFVLRYFVDSARRFVKKVKILQPHESVLLKFFIRIGRLPLYEYGNAFKELKQSLFPVGKESIVPDDALGFIDYRLWIEEKMKGKSMKK